MTMKSSVFSAFSKIKAPLFLSSLSHSPVIKRLQRLPRALWILAAVLVVAAAGGYAYYQVVYLPAQATAAEPAMQTATVRQGDLVIYASGTGTLISNDESDLAFETGGKVTKIDV